MVLAICCVRRRRGHRSKALGASGKLPLFDKEQPVAQKTGRSPESFWAHKGEVHALDKGNGLESKASFEAVNITADSSPCGPVAPSPAPSGSSERWALQLAVKGCKTPDIVRRVVIKATPYTEEIRHKSVFIIRLC